MQTIEIDGRTFSVEVSPKADRSGGARYILRKVGGRGLTYETMRNVNRPGLMFCINPNASKLPGIWLSDEGGDLRQVILVR